MSADQAIRELDELQAQIIDGKPTFREIADVLREAKELINSIGTTGSDRGEVIRRAQKWLGLEL